mmetsp:Transcript_16177/g.35152  ORF Transcript_16177/g.35152 Transcript_16177/m.35152 type:complete len:205 (-) Transcript_16177:692-1306(-)
MLRLHTTAPSPLRSVPFHARGAYGLRSRLGFLVCVCVCVCGGVLVLVWGPDARHCLVRHPGHVRRGEQRHPQASRQAPEPVTAGLRGSGGAVQQSSPRRACLHVQEGAGQHAQPATQHIRPKLHRGEAVEIVADRKRKKGAEAQQGNDSEPFAPDGLVNGGELRVVRSPVQHPLAKKVARCHKGAGCRDSCTNGGGNGARHDAE